MSQISDLLEHALLNHKPEDTKEEIDQLEELLIAHLDNIIEQAKEKALPLKHITEAIRL